MHLPQSIGAGIVKDAHNLNATAMQLCRLFEGIDRAELGGFANCNTLDSSSTTE